MTAREAASRLLESAPPLTAVIAASICPLLYGGTQDQGQAATEAAA